MSTHPRVQVLSDRPSMNGRDVFGKTGQATVVPGDDDVYIEGEDWYGSWPKGETNLMAVIMAETKAELTAKSASNVRTAEAARTEQAGVASYLVDERGEIAEGLDAIKFLKDMAKDG